MPKKKFTAIEDVLTDIKTDLDTPNPQNPEATKVSVLFACNASGKTRLSKLFADQHDEHVLYYNAFTEDLFAWDNTDYVLKIDTSAWLFKFIQEQGLDRRIIDNFQKFTGSKLEPAFDFAQGQVTFALHTGDEEAPENIKISRGEESVFIWSVFYTVLDIAIDTLNEPVEDRSTEDFNDIQYIMIDDPVSSMDDTRIITVALDLAELIAKSKGQLKFLVTTHHALFFNVLFNAKKKNWNRKNYILSKSGTDIILKIQPNDSPFAYHHVIKHEIEKAINDNDVKKYHFNLFRALLEKTANFLGYADGWKKCLQGTDAEAGFVKALDHYSHNSLSDLESKDLSEDDKQSFKRAFETFMQEFKWGAAA